MTYSRPPSIVDGKYVKAATVNQALVTNMSESMHRLAYRSVDLAKTNDATPAADPQLSFVVGADELWYFEAHCRHFSAANGVPNVWIKMSFPIPGEMCGYSYAIATDAATYQMETTSSDSGLGNDGQWYSTTSAKTVVEKHLLFARTAGTVAVLWSQVSSSASHTTMMKGSNIQGCKIGALPSGADTPFIT